MFFITFTAAAVFPGYSLDSIMSKMMKAEHLEDLN